MCDLAILFLHLLATVARLVGPGGTRSVVAESVLVKHQLLILNRSRKRSPNLRPSDRVVAGLCALFMRPGRVVVVQRTDLDLETDPRARALAIADNRVAELDLDWDPAVLDQLRAAGLDVS